MEHEEGCECIWCVCKWLNEVASVNFTVEEVEEFEETIKKDRGCILAF